MWDIAHRAKDDLVGRIFCLCDVGFTLTPNSLRTAVFNFCAEENIEYPFNNDKKRAGSDINYDKMNNSSTEIL